MAETNELPAPRPATEEEFDDFVQTCISEEGWHLVHERQRGEEKLQVWDQPPKDGNTKINIVKVHVVYPDVDPAVLYDVLHDPDYRKEWDDKMIEGYEIEKLNATNDVGYYSVKAPMGVSNRDFVNERSWRVKENYNGKGGKEYVIMNHSVLHPKVPEKKGFVRARSIRTGYLIRALENGGCEFFYYTQTDPQGWIPAWLINQMTKTLAPSIIDNLKKVSTGYVEWKSQHNPERKPWLGN